MDGAKEIVERAKEWVQRDERVLGAFLHGSAARGDVTPLSDVDLVVVAIPGRRGEIWAERDQISRTLLGAAVVEAHAVPHQRPFRWQARTADLRKIDLALDEGAIDMWAGLAAETKCLLDRADARLHGGGLALGITVSGARAACSRALALLRRRLGSRGSECPGVPVAPERTQKEPS